MGVGRLTGLDRNKSGYRIEMCYLLISQRELFNKIILRVKITNQHNMAVLAQDECCNLAPG